MQPKHSRVDSKVEDSLLIVSYQSFGVVGRWTVGALIRLKEGREFHHCFSKFAIDAQSDQKINDDNQQRSKELTRKSKEDDYCCSPAKSAFEKSRRT